MVKKLNNSRRFPGESNRCRPDRAAERREQAKARQKKSDDLSPQQKIEKLNTKFGEGQGAKKERARLLLAQQNAPQRASKASATLAVELETATIPEELMAEIEAMNEETNVRSKKLKAKDRRARDQKVNN